MEEISTSDEHRARGGPDLLLLSRNQQILQTTCSQYSVLELQSQGRVHSVHQQNRSERTATVQVYI